MSTVTSDGMNRPGGAGASCRLQRGRVVPVQPAPTLAFADRLAYRLHHGRPSRHG
jgi:hypothetical protein